MYVKRALKVEAKQFRGSLTALKEWCDYNNVTGQIFDAATFIVLTKMGYKTVTNGEWIAVDELGNVSVHEHYEMNLLYHNPEAEDD